MKSNIIFILLLFCFNKIFAENNFNGNWYYFSKKYLIELNISDSLMLTQKIMWDFSKKPNSEPDSQRIISKSINNDTIYYKYKHSAQTDTNYYLTAFYQQPIIHKNLDSLSNYNDKQIVKCYFNSDTAYNFAIQLFRFKELEEMKILKDISEMTKQILKAF